MEEEAELQYKMLQHRISEWMHAELTFLKKLNWNVSVSVGHSPNWWHTKFKYFMTSSQSMMGIKELRQFIFRKPEEVTFVLPKHWSKMYSLLYDQTDANKNFITKLHCENVLKKCLPFHRKLFGSANNLDQCLQFLHNSRMILWYGEHNKNLENFIFYDPQFLVSLFQCLFQHDLKEQSYNHEKHRQYIQAKTEFDMQLKVFMQTGNLNSMLLRCFLEKFNFTPKTFDTMIELLVMFELCYKSTEPEETILRFPWFMQNGGGDFLANEWSKCPSPSSLQFSLHYCFCHRIPGMIYERFCVRLQHHLQRGGHTRKDWKNMVYIEQNQCFVMVVGSFQLKMLSVRQGTQHFTDENKVSRK